MRVYKATYDSTKTLAENQEILLAAVVETCFDFSFRVKRSTQDGILYGQTSSGEQIAIFNKGNLFGHFDGPITTSAAFFSCSHLYNFDDELKRQIMSYLTTLVQDPVGCKLLRIVTAKFAANQLPKIVFVPTDKDDSSFYFCESQYAGKILEEVYLITLTESRPCQSPKFVADGLAEVSVA